MGVPGKLSASVFEFLAGLLAVGTIFVLFLSFFPEETEATASQVSDFADGAPLVTAGLLVGAAMALGFGIVFEYLGRVSLEWWLDRIKKTRLARFHADLSQRSGFDDMVRPGRTIIDSHGEMRFFVLMMSPGLYHEVEAQILRMRLVRVLALCESIWLVAAMRELARQPSDAMWTAVAFLAMFTCVTVVAVRTQFHRYCRAIERSCLVLFLKEVKGK